MLSDVKFSGTLLAFDGASLSVSNRILMSVLRSLFDPDEPASYMSYRSVLFHLYTSVKTLKMYGDVGIAELRKK